MNKSEFEEVVKRAVENLPLHFKGKLENLEIVVEEDMPRGFGRRGAVLLGLYKGIPLKKRSVWHSATLPDKITIYKNTIEKICKNEAEIKKRIEEVLYHEIGHYFGLTEEQLMEINHDKKR